MAADPITSAVQANWREIQSRAAGIVQQHPEYTPAQAITLAAKQFVYIPQNQSLDPYGSVVNVPQNWGTLNAGASVHSPAFQVWYDGLMHGTLAQGANGSPQVNVFNADATGSGGAGSSAGAGGTSEQAGLTQSGDMTQVGDTSGAAGSTGAAVTNAATTGAQSTSLWRQLLPSVISGVASVVGAVQSSSAAKDAAQLQYDASQKALAQLQHMYDTTHADLAPYVATGTNALTNLRTLTAPRS